MTIWVIDQAHVQHLAWDVCPEAESKREAACHVLKGLAANSLATPSTIRVLHSRDRCVAVVIVPDLLPWYIYLYHHYFTTTYQMQTRMLDYAQTECTSIPSRLSSQAFSSPKKVPALIVATEQL